MSKEVLDTCLEITGAFENGKLNYAGITGNFDGQGISVGILQWNAGTGSLGHLIKKIIENSSDEFVDEFFDVAVSTLAVMNARDQKQFIVDNFLQGGSLNPTEEQKQQWINLLSSEASVQAQVTLAEEGVLAKAISLADTYVLNGASNLRVIAFFFDLVTQSGGMSNSRGSVRPLTPEDELQCTQAIALARTKSNKTAAIWEATIQLDSMAKVLLHYAYARALLSRPEYIWDALSRRGAIACRGGSVHGKLFSFTNVLP